MLGFGLLGRRRRSEAAFVEERVAVVMERVSGLAGLARCKLDQSLDDRILELVTKEGRLNRLLDAFSQDRNDGECDEDEYDGFGRD